MITLAFGVTVYLILKKGATYFDIPVALWVISFICDTIVFFGTAYFIWGQGK
jgi:hypothetical protein